MLNNFSGSVTKGKFCCLTTFGVHQPYGPVFLVIVFFLELPDGTDTPPCIICKGYHIALHWMFYLIACTSRAKASRSTF